MVLPQSPGRLGGLEFLIIAVWMAGGLIAYYWRQRRHPLAETERGRLILGEFA